MFMKCHENSSINSGHVYSVPPYNKEVNYDIAQQITWHKELTHKLQKSQTHQIYYQLQITHTILSTHEVSFIAAGITCNICKTVNSVCYSECL